MTHEKFMEIVRNRNRWESHPENWSVAERLRERVLNGIKSDEEWLELENELIQFIAERPPREEVMKLQGCGEALTMICNSIREKKEKAP